VDCYFKEHVHEHYIHIRFIGDVDDDMLLRYLDDIFVIPETGSKDQLVDYSEVTGLFLTAGGIFEFAICLTTTVKRGRVTKTKEWPLSRQEMSLYWLY